MANSLKVTRLDSPLQGLRRSNSDGTDTAPADSPRRSEAEDRPSPGVVARAPATAAAPAARRSRPRPAAETPTDALASPAAADAWPPAQGFWQPPALDERVDLVSTRLPVSLSRALERHTRGLRDRHDLASQKALPMQEVLAAAVWALGDPQDEAAVDRLDAIYRSYRARRMAAAAKALEQTS
jgi:hypothetical protein